MSDTQITVVTPERRPLWLFGTAAADALERLLAERDVALRTETRAVTVEHDALLLAGGERLPADAVVALPAPHRSGRRGSAGRRARLPARRRATGASRCRGRLRRRRRHGVPASSRAGLATQQADAVAEAIAATARGDRAAGPLPAGPARAAAHRRRTALPARRAVGAGRAARRPRRGRCRRRAARRRRGRCGGRRPRSQGATSARTSRARGRGRSPPSRCATARPWRPPRRRRTSDDAFLLAVLVAEEDARLGDYGAGRASARRRGRPPRRPSPDRARGAARRLGRQGRGDADRLTHRRLIRLSTAGGQAWARRLIAA